MSWLQFIADLVSALAWPVSVVIVVLLFKRQILLLLPEVRRLKFKEFELEFRESVKEAERVIEGSKALPPAQAPDQDRLSYLLALARTAPRAAVLEAWLDVEAAALRALRRKRTDLRSGVFRQHGIRLGSELVEAGVLPPEMRQAYESLRSLRNKAAHVPDVVFNPEEVADYIEVAHSLARRLDAA